MSFLSLSLDILVLASLIFLLLLARFIYKDPEKRATMGRLAERARTALTGKNDGGGGGGEMDHPSSNSSMMTTAAESRDERPRKREEEEGEERGGGKGERGEGEGEGQLKAVPPPTPADVARYRFHHGANLGSVFVLEKWLTGSMFATGVSGASELAAVEGWVKAEGEERARARMEAHWSGYVGVHDLDWLRDVAGCNTVRLPVGHFSLGPAFCGSTPFEPVKRVYGGAWRHVRELVAQCHERGIGVIVDLHALPGGANGDSHSGTDGGRAGLWTSTALRELATRCVCFVAREAREMDGVVGIQIANEVEWKAAATMYAWYEGVLAEVARIDASMPVYVSDGWDLGRALSWSQARNSVRRAGDANPVVVDTHLYWAHTAEDRGKSAQQITEAEVPRRLSELDGKDGDVFDRGAAVAFVGEYSCALDPASWSRGGGGGTPHDELVRRFGNAQCQRFRRRAGGSTFWTYRMDWMPGGEWGFRQMVEARAIEAPAALTLGKDEVRRRVAAAHADQQHRRQTEAVAAHRRYWDGRQPQTGPPPLLPPPHYEHWRFERGWDVGWRDAAAFFEARGLHHDLHGADTIGLLDLWVLKRLRETGQTAGFAWEFEHGLRQGVRDFYDSVGVGQ